MARKLMSMLRISETKAVKLKMKGLSDRDIIREYLRQLHREKDAYFELNSDPKLHAAYDSDHDDDDVDSDYESGISSVIGSSQENISVESSLRASIPDSDEFSPASGEYSADLVFSSKRSYTVKPTSLEQTSHNEWEIECTSQVIKKLKYRRTPDFLRKAIYTTVINDLASGRNWIPVTTKDKIHHLYRKEILGGRVSLLWEKAIQFSPKLSSEDNDVYVDVIRLWDIVVHERSLKTRIKAIERAWSKGGNTANTLRQYKPTDDQNHYKTVVQRTFKRVLSQSTDPSDIQYFPPADPDPAKYTPVTLHAFPSKLEHFIKFSTSQKFDIPLKIWPEEHKILSMNFTGPVFVLGRSGTGKTTCCLYRMIEEFLTYKKLDFPLRQLFVTKNRFLCEKFQSHFERLIAYSSEHSFCDSESINASSGHIKELPCPLFLTWEEFLTLLDTSFLKDHSVYDDTEDSLFNDYKSSSIEDIAQSEELSRDSKCSECSYDCLTSIGEVVTADEFVNNIWKKEIKFKHNLKPELVWMEIKSFIKGYYPTRVLSKEEYLQLSVKIAPNFPDDESRLAVYDIYEQYKRYCERFMKLQFEIGRSKMIYDECDLVFNIYKNLLQLRDNQESIEWLFDSLYVDEVQDFTQSEVLLLVQSCKSTKCNIFLTGDTAQTVMRDVSFRFKDLKTSFFTNEDISEQLAPPIYDLTINYRSHSGILNLAGHILSLLERYFPHSIDRVPRDNGLFPGPLPKFIKSCHSESLELIIGANIRKTSKSPFGHHQAVIVRKEESKKMLPFTEEDIQVFSVYESKGLEYDDVLLYNFFSEAKHIWKKAFKDVSNQVLRKTPESMLLNIELKQLYTAITRAKVNLWIYESEPIDEHDLPILSQWREGVDGMPLVEVINPDDPNFKFDITFATAKTSTPRQWKMQGDRLLKNKRWKQAILCYRKANRSDLEAETEAMALETESPPQHHTLSLAYLKLNEITGTAAYLVKVAEHLLQAAKLPEEFIEASWLYKRLNKKKESVKTLIVGKQFMKASELCEEYKDYERAVQVLLDGKLYLEAAVRAKQFENLQNITSNSIAMSHILKYSRPPEEVNETEERIFYGLLSYIEDTDYKCFILKHSKRFTEALEYYFKAGNSANFYRLAFAQGTNRIYSKNNPPNETTLFYDSAMRLSWAHEHKVVRTALIIQISRAYFSLKKNYPILLVTDLERLLFSSDKNDSTGLKLNALLLLARNDVKRQEEAFEFCRKYKNLSGEIELFLHTKEKRPFSKCYQFDMLFKVQILLSADEDSLVTEYTNILGVHKDDQDKLYMQQRTYVTNIPNYKKSFESDCYLLPNESQDIWLNNLTDGKSQENDGMIVIPSQILFKKIKNHLLQGRESLEKPLVELLQFFHHHLLQHLQSSPSLCKPTVSCVHFDANDAKFYLEFCTFQLLYSQTNEDVTSAIQCLRQYHSIATVYHYPLCENYMAHIRKIRRDAWHNFQSKTKKWIVSQFSNPEKFDFLKVWEQASIADLKSDLKEQLHIHSSIRTTESHLSISEAAKKGALIWFNICDDLINDPFMNCVTFFRTCMPHLLESDQPLCSVIYAMNIHSAILLTTITCMTSESLLIPDVYVRSLSVYESLIVKPPKRIVSLCFVLYKNNDLLQEALQLLQDTLNEVIPSLLQKLIPAIQCDFLLRQSLVLILILLTNFALLWPKVSKLHDPSIANFSSSMKQYLSKISSSSAHYKAAKAAIKEATSTLDLINIIEHLLCPVQSGRYEEIVSVKKTKKGIYYGNTRGVRVINLPSSTLLMRRQRKNTPKLPAGTQLAVSPLLPKSKRMENLSFCVSYREVGSERHSVGKSSNINVPPWMTMPTNEDLSNPDKTEFLNLGFLSSKGHPDSSIKVNTEKDHSICHICKTRMKADHQKSVTHARNLELYKQFLRMHDMDYTMWISECRLALKSIEDKKLIYKDFEDFEKGMENLIFPIYKNGEWEKGISLIQTYCIPEVKKMTKLLTNRSIAIHSAK